MRVGAYFFVEPAFRYRCASVGSKLQVWNLPEIHGCPSIHIGEQVNIYGRLKIEAPAYATSPRLRIGNSVEIGNRVSFVVTSQIVIEDFVNIAQRSTISDIDLFSPGQAAPESQPVTTRICRGAWIGIGSVITRGVTVGEGAIIGSGSVVTNNIPPFSVALGNPARVIVKDTRTSG